MGDGKRINIYLRTRINEGGLHYKPGPVIQARQNSDLTLNLALKDLSSGKNPINLPGLGVFNVDFIVRKLKYPISGADILIARECSWVDSGYVVATLTYDDLAITATDYWYDILVKSQGALYEGAGSTKRPPLGRFIVVK